MSSNITVHRDGGVLRITLDRPEKKNALTSAMYESMTIALDVADKDPHIGAIMIEGAGGNFTAGNDINDFIEHASHIGESAGLRFIRRLAICDTPIVAAVDGFAVGIGTTMLFHCDLIYATPRTTFRMPFVDLGLVPEAGASLLVPARLGMARATELLLLGEGFGPVHALEWGVINGIVEPDHVAGKALEMARKLAEKPRTALNAARRLMRGDRTALVARIDEEIQLFGRALHSEEARAAMLAFMSRNRQKA